MSKAYKEASQERGKLWEDLLEMCQISMAKKKTTFTLKLKNIFELLRLESNGIYFIL